MQKIGIPLYFPLVFITTLACFVSGLTAQNSEWSTGISIGVGNSGFNTSNPLVEKTKPIYYLSGGFPFHFRLSDRWALNIYLGISQSGNVAEFAPINQNINRSKIVSTFSNLALSPKRYLSQNLYLALGPEFLLLAHSYQSLYNEKERLYRDETTHFFKKFSLSTISTLGFSWEIGRLGDTAFKSKNILAFVEFRFRRGITHLFKQDFLDRQVPSRVTAFELASGVLFASKQ